jgi:hypothetical protein
MMFIYQSGIVQIYKVFIFENVLNITDNLYLNHLY